MHATHTTQALILSIYRDLAEAFVEALTPEQREGLPIDGQVIRFDVVSGDPGQEPAFEEHISQANAIAVVVRFLDVLSLEKIKAIYRHLPSDSDVPLAIFLLRDKGEVDFKISCPSCGQKLWLRDTDIGKRGRCPNCKKPFVILSQADHLKAQLMLPDNVTILKVVRGDLESLQNAMLKLLESLSVGLKPLAAETHGEALKNATMRIQIQET